MINTNMVHKNLILNIIFIIIISILYHHYKISISYYFYLNLLNVYEVNLGDMDIIIIISFVLWLINHHNRNF